MKNGDWFCCAGFHGSGLSDSRGARGSAGRGGGSDPSCCCCPCVAIGAVGGQFGVVVLDGIVVDETTKKGCGSEVGKWLQFGKVGKSLLIRDLRNYFKGVGNHVNLVVSQERFGKVLGKVCRACPANLRWEADMEPIKSQLVSQFSQFLNGSRYNIHETKNFKASNQNTERNVERQRYIGTTTRSDSQI